MEELLSCAAAPRWAESISWHRSSRWQQLQPTMPPVATARFLAMLSEKMSGPRVFRAPADQVRSQGAEAHRRGTRQSDVQRRPAGDLHQEYPQRHRRGRYHSEPPSGHWRRHRLGHAAHALVHYPGARHYQRFDPGLQSQQLARPTHIQLLAASDGYCEVRDEMQESEGTDFGGTDR